jgi:RND family efflux transporter MFP subunit
MQPGVDAVSLRAKANTELAAWKKELGDLGMNPAASDLDSALQKGKAHLAVIKNFLNRTYDSLLVAVPTVNFPQSSITTAQGTVNSARSSVDQLISNLVSAGQAVQNSSTSLSQAQAALEQKEAPAETSDVESAKAQVLSAQAGVESAQIDYENTIVKAPFSGQIAVLDVQKGDQASPSAAVATIVGNQKIAEVTLNEVDVPNVQLGQRATLTFSAVDGLEIAGKVLEVENVGTANQGVVNYTVKIGFDTQDQRIKAGMSVTAAIVTSIKNDVLAVPNSAIKSMGQQHYVEVLDPAAIQASPSNPSMSVSEKEPERRMVEIGVSNDSQTEITSGLNPGELVVTQTVNSSQKTTASSNSGIRIPGGGFGR